MTAGPDNPPLIQAKIADIKRICLVLRADWPAILVRGKRYMFPGQCRPNVGQFGFPKTKNIVFPLFGG